MRVALLQGQMQGQMQEKWVRGHLHDGGLCVCEHSQVLFCICSSLFIKYVKTYICSSLLTWQWTLSESNRKDSSLLRPWKSRWPWLKVPFRLSCESCLFWRRIRAECESVWCQARRHVWHPQCGGQVTSIMFQTHIKTFCIWTPSFSLTHTI